MTGALGPTTRALLIGIDKSAAAPQLHGCVNDVRLMSKTLEQQAGFGSDNIKLLVNEAATRQAILQALDAISTEASPNTAVYLHFSGWGARLRKAERDQPVHVIKPWAGQYSTGAVGVSVLEYESALLPYDWSETAATTALRYDDVRRWLAGLPTTSVTVVFDAPYSGTLLGDAAPPQQQCDLPWGSS